MKQTYKNKNQEGTKIKKNPKPSVKEKPKEQKPYGEMLRDARRPDKK